MFPQVPTSPYESDPTKQSILDFMTLKSYDFKMKEEEISKIFSSNENVSAKAISSFFGSVNRALRQHCIQQIEQIISLKRLGFVFAILSCWKIYLDTLCELSEQITLCFKENVKKTKTSLALDSIIEHLRSSVIRIGLRNWKRYILAQRNIGAELDSSILLLLENPEFYSFSNVNVPNFIHTLFSMFPNTISPEEDWMFFNTTKLISTYLWFFSKHKYLYPIEEKQHIKECSIIADSLYTYIKYSPKCYHRSKQYLKSFFSVFHLNDFTTIQFPYNYSVFDNPEYIRIMEMISICDQEYYLSSIIPEQIKYMLTFKTTSLTTNFDKTMEILETIFLPMFEKGINIIEKNPKLVHAFADSFANAIFRLSFLSDPTLLFLEDKQEHIQCIWKLSCQIPQCVTSLSYAFISFHKPLLEKAVKAKDEEQLQMLVAKINWLVDGVFQHHPTMVLARSTLFIPHQRDTELISRARVLIEQAQIPARQSYSIAELFDIVPFVKNKQLLLDEISHFIKNQLLSQISPSVELEKSLIDSLGQYTEAEFITPLQSTLKEFSQRYDDFNVISTEHNFGNIRFAVLSNLKWKQIVKRGILECFDDFSKERTYFENEYKKLKPRNKLIWCDSSSVVECRAKYDGKSLLFLFNGIQYAIVNFMSYKKNTALSDLIKNIPVDELEEQLQTLVEYKLIEKDPKSRKKYRLAKYLPSSLHRNFARKYTSAENIALNQMLETDRRKTVNCIIVRNIKKSGKNGMSMNEIIDSVQNEALNHFSVTAEFIREQMNELEVTKYIKLKEETGNGFVFIP